MLRELKFYVFSAAVTAAILAWVFDLRHCDPRVPLYDAVGHDSLQSLVWFKTMEETGWVHQNGRLGVPGVMDMYDFPAPRLVLDLITKALIVLGGDAVTAHNLFFFLGFFLSGWSCLFVLRRLGVSSPTALAGGLLFAFLPAHFWRGTWHLTLGFYPAVPLGVMLCLWICAEQPLFFARKPVPAAPAHSPAGSAPAPGGSGRAVAAAAVALLMSAAGIYYAWFMGFFLIVSGLVVWLRRPRWAIPWDAAVCVLILLVGLGLQTIPLARHWRTHERAPEALRRAAGASQWYSLAVAELVLPTVGHRIPQWRIVESRRSVLGGADPRNPRIGHRIGMNERYYNALGVIGSAGFLFLCVAILAPPAPWLESLWPVPDLAKLNIAGVLLGSGFALLFEYFVPQIRAYDRIAIYLAFFSLVATAVVFDRLRLRSGRSPRANMLFLLALTVATTLGLLDQIPGVMTPDHQAQSAAYAEERGYVRAVEGLVGPDALIFELPYCDYPEPSDCPGNELFRPYMHSRRLRFSHGASRGTNADRWHSAVAAKPPATMTAELVRAGFTGLHVDFGLAPDGGAALRAQLDRELGPPDLTAKRGQWQFYRLPRSTATSLERSQPSSGSR
jgi:phosphoglycerol transferase